jgi:MFS family permease
VTRRSLFPVFLTYFLDNFGLAIIYPIFTPLFLEHHHLFTGASPSYLERTLFLGLLIGTFPLAQFFSAPLIGQFSDRFGRKRAFFITILGTSIGYTMTAMSLMAESLPILFFSRFFTGIFAGNLTLCLAAVADMSPDEASRTRNFGQIASIGGLSFIVAIGFGGLLSHPSFGAHFDPSIPLWITACLGYLNLYCMLRLFKESHPSKPHPGFNPFKGIHNLTLGIQNNTLRSIYCVNFFFMLAWVSSMQFLPAFFIKEFSFTIGNITLALMAVGFLWSFTNLIINPQLARRLFPGKTLLSCLIALSLLLLFTTLTHHPATFFPLFYLAVTLASLCWTNGLATISLSAPAEIQGSILGINQSMTSIAAITAPLIGGLVEGINPHAVFLFSGISCFLSFRILLKSKCYKTPC